MIVLYNLVLFVFFIPALAFFAFRYRHRVSAGGVFWRWADRFGRARLNPAAAGRKLIWFHCASLGEVRAIEPLIVSMGDIDTVISTLTLTGYEYAQERGLGTQRCFAPLDFSFFAHRALRSCRPDVLAIVETELWPGLIHAAGKLGIPVVIINGRMSVRSFPWYKAMRPFWRWALKPVTLLCARADEDAGRFIATGLAASKVTVTGNIKYDRPFPPPSFTRHDLGLSEGDLVLVAGSVRPGEVKTVFDAFTAARLRFPTLRLLIAPRHMHAVRKIVGEAFDRNLRTELRSQRVGGYDCLVIDTYGELASLYALCDVAFVGASLVNRGGQNPIEPAAYGKPVLFGPFMDNFLTEAGTLKKGGGGFVVTDAESFASTLESFFTDPTARAVAGRHAKEVLAAQQGALARTREHLLFAAGSC